MSEMSEFVGGVLMIIGFVVFLISGVALLLHGADLAVEQYGAFWASVIFLVIGLFVLLVGVVIDSWAIVRWVEAMVDD